MPILSRKKRKVAFRTYDEAYRYLCRFTNYEKVPGLYDERTYNLERMRRLLERLGNPQGDFKSIHIAGTKGKGSTAIVLSSILQEAGYRVGLYTSPHFLDLRERIEINRRWISRQEFARCLREVVGALDGYAPTHMATFFELVTAAAFLHFQRERVDWAVVEVGVGGRLDATNVLVPRLSVLTHIDFDHMERLGNTLEEIAREKSGIIKPGIPSVSAESRPEVLEVFCRAAERNRSDHTALGRDYQIRDVSTGFDEHRKPFTQFVLETSRGAPTRLSLPGLGRHQAVNASLAVTAAELLAARGELDLPGHSVVRGLRESRFPGRQEIVRKTPWLLVDSAHNPDSITALLDTLQYLPSPGRRTFVVGISRDKQLERILSDLSERCDRLVLTSARHPRAASPQELYGALPTDIRQRVPIDLEPSAPKAVRRILRAACATDWIVVTGSVYLAGEILANLPAS